MFTLVELANTLEAVGLKHTDTVLIHSAASAIGEAEGGTEGILQLLCDYFSGEGLLVMPAMTYTLIHAWDPQSERCRRRGLPSSGRQASRNRTWSSFRRARWSSH